MKRMSNQQKKMKRYCNNIKRRLNFPRSVKLRVMNDFASSIAARREMGADDETIYTELGTPKEVADLLNDQMKEYAFRKSKWRWVALGAAVVSAGLLMWTKLVNWLLAFIFGTNAGENASLGMIGGADGPTAIFLTTGPGMDWDAVLFTAVIMIGIGMWWFLGHLKQK